MAILDGDIQLLRSEVMDDVPEGGGMATGSVVIDGVSNNLFPDISEADRTYGRIGLRKIFPAAVTDDTATYFGANMIVANPALDPKIGVSIFTTKSWSDTRAAAKDKLESYLAMGAEGRWMLYGNHLAGQRTLQLHCPHTLASPAVDDVLALVQRDAETVFQYVRVQRLVSRAVNVEFEDSKGIFYRDVITLELTAALLYAFKAATLERYTADWFSQPTRIHVTVAADAASYYGVQPLRIAAALGDLTIKAQSIYTQLVPSALAETPITDARCASSRSVIVPIEGAGNIGFTSAINVAAGVTAVRYFGSAFARGTLAIAVGGVDLTDDGSGNIVATSGFSGSVDYEAGSIALARSTGISSAVVFSAAPAVAISAPGHTDSTSITTGNRGYAYVKSLSPVPAPGTVEVSYMAQGKWYSLYDDGVGVLSGNEGTGIGQVDYATGAIVLTLGALPDADTEILFSWGSPAHYESHVGANVFAVPAIKLVISGGALEPGALSIRYLAAGIEKIVTDDGAGILVGDGTGYADYSNGQIVLRPSVLPDSNSNLQVSYKQGGQTTEIHAAAGALTNFSLAHAVEPGSLSLTFTDSVGGHYLVTDNGAGNLIFRSADLSSASATTNVNGQSISTNSVLLGSASGISGTVNYATGAVALAAVIALSLYTQAWGLSAWTSNAKTSLAAGNISATYRVAGNAAGGVQNISATLPDLAIDILPTVTNTLVEGGTRFTLGGSTYVDRAGVIIKDPDHNTNSGVVAGSINYTTGVTTINNYTGGGSPTLNVSSLTRRGSWTDYKIKFRSSGAPLQSASLYVHSNRADTYVTISGTGTAGGDIGGSNIDGSVDYTTGIVNVQFGNWVAIGTLTADDLAAWWYDAANIVAGQIFKPILVLPETAKYNGVVTSSLPLSADILGLDPVRLPIDGKVPIFRKGDLVVVHHTATSAQMTVANGQTINLGRERLAKVHLINAAGATINAGYTQDLDAGEITITSITGWAQPITIENRVEDMTLVADVQINGELTIGEQLTHDFPLGSFVSSALYIGDMHARVSVFFDQSTWAGWSDTQSGNAATGTYNKTQYPVVVTNRGAIEERWEIIFTNTGTVNVIGETVGQIVTGHSIINALAPENPAQGVPYFSINPLGWGQGWAAGNVLRFNTIAANYPVWVARTILQGNATVSNDKFTLGVRGDVDAA
jgi:hypothetical protein